MPYYEDLFDEEDKRSYDLSTDLSSSKSMRVSLEAIRKGDAGLNIQRKQILNKVPNKNDFATFDRYTIRTKDLAYLSAFTGDEFALIRSKNHDIVFHGTPLHCDFTDDLKEWFMSGKLELVAHSHPNYPMIVPSADDKDFLRKIGQEKSKIISWYTGIEIEFSSSES